MQKGFCIGIREEVKMSISSISDVYTQEVDINGWHQILLCWRYDRGMEKWTEDAVST